MTNTSAAIMGLVSFVIAVTLAVIIVGTFEESTLSDCTVSWASETNTTTLIGGGQHGFLLTGYVEGSDEKDSNLTVTYVPGNVNCNVTTASGAWIANLDGTSPDTITLPKSYVTSPFKVNYTNCGSTNITQSNITYLALSASCPYTYSGYDSTKKITDVSFNVLGIASIVAIILVAGILISAVSVFTKK